VRSEWLKRAVDLIGAAAGLVLAAPVMAAVSSAVAVDLGRPVLFRQIRHGRNAREFELVKFRTMRDARDAGGALRPDAERLTRLGRWLRASSLDELPQLWNVLRGEMSLVGPRPLLVPYVARYSPEQARRLLVKPGITGWCQINGRNANGWDAKLALDTWYADHWSNLLDLRILIRTVGAVLRRDGVSAPGDATMPEFMGSSATAPDRGV
jgi:lipopolysaccharide/colanic/teichoic acid biosynthesis glycosyltransferase